MFPQQSSLHLPSSSSDRCRGCDQWHTRHEAFHWKKTGDGSETLWNSSVFPGTLVVGPTFMLHVLHVDPCWSMLIHVDPCWSMLIYVDPYPGYFKGSVRSWRNAWKAMIPGIEPFWFVTARDFWDPIWTVLCKISADHPGCRVCTWHVPCLLKASKQQQGSAVS